MKSNSVANLLVSSVLLSIATYATAIPEVTVGNANFYGDGCELESRNNIRVRTGNGNSAILVNFEDYNVRAGGFTERFYHNKRCHIDIPLNVPAGYYITVERLEYTGDAFVPLGAKLSMQSRISFNGLRGVDSYKEFGIDENGRIVEHFGEFEFSTPVSLDSRSGTNCPQNVTLSIDSSIRAQTNRQNDSTEGYLSYAQAQGKFVYDFRLRPCRNF